VPGAHVCNPSYLGGWDPEDGGLKPAWATSSQDLPPTSPCKITRAKWTGGVAQAVDACFVNTKPWGQTQAHKKKNYMVFVFLWLAFHSFLRLNNIPLCMHTPHCKTIHPLIDT
jgi:hypothetical protein